MELIIHPAAAKDAREIAAKYADVSGALPERFWGELDTAIDMIAAFPERHHYDPSGLRRSNLVKFPYHVLFEQRLDCIRIIVIRHHHRNPSYGLRRR
jgi:plasmid stabilization system protein ParE